MMITTWFITLVVLIVFLGLITFLMCQNQKNKKQVTKDFSAEFPDPEFIDENRLNDER